MSRRSGDSSEHFRANVGIIVARADGHVLAIERPRQPGHWQLPQGGIQRGEEPEDAVYRELAEETGLLRAHVREIDRLDEWLAYELPEELRSEKTGLGQVQKWFLLGLSSEQAAQQLRPSREARSFKWTRLDALAQEVVEFRRAIYKKLWEHFRGRLEAMKP